MVLIREVKEQDLEGLASLFSEFDQGVPDAGEMKVILRKYSCSEDYVYLCAEKDGKIVGSLTGVVGHSLLTQFSPFMVIEDVIVLCGHRGDGIGRKLMKRIEEIAREKGCRQIMFVSSAFRKEAHKFYESLGYRLDEVQGFRKGI